MLGVVSALTSRMMAVTEKATADISLRGGGGGGGAGGASGELHMTVCEEGHLCNKRNFNRVLQQGTKTNHISLCVNALFQEANVFTNSNILIEI